MARNNDKRLRLIEAADTLVFENTFNLTTLAHIAQKAEVPLGNVYYYFKTKDEILKAVLKTRYNQFQERLTAWNLMPQPLDRLHAYVNETLNNSETLAKFGCSFGSLCQELAKEPGQVANLSAQFLHLTLKWLVEQFQQIHSSKPELLAEHLLATMQGHALITCTFKDPDLVKAQAKLLGNWLNQQQEIAA